MHNTRTYRNTLLAGLLGCSAVLAQTEEVDDPTVLSPGEEKVTQKIASDFEGSAGENALPLIEALRTGSDLSYDVEKEIEVEVPLVDADGKQVYRLNTDDGTQALDAEGNPIPETTIEKQTVIETVTVENTAGPLGFGNVKISMLLAEERLSQEGLEGNISMADYTGALFGTDPAIADGVLEMRAEGAGWGEISQELLGTKLGTLMSGKNAKNTKNPADPGTVESATGESSAAPKAAAAKTRAPETKGSSGQSSIKRATANTGQSARKPSAPKPKKIVTAQRSKPERSTSKPQRVERVSRPSKPERPVKPSRPERPTRPERPERPEKPAKPDRPNR